MLHREVSHTVDAGAVYKRKGSDRDLDATQRRCWRRALRAPPPHTSRCVGVGVWAVAMGSSESVSAAAVPPELNGSPRISCVWQAAAAACYLVMHRE